MSITDSEILNRTFAEDVFNGLSHSPKQLSSKYFYDADGDRLFQEIMRMPEYYLTDAEFEILSTYKDDFLSILNSQAFDLIELGAGDGLKTKILLTHFLEQGADFSYRPIDISGHALSSLQESLSQELPELNVKGQQGDYFKALEQMYVDGNRAKFLLFMGANIGNFSKAEARQFLKTLRNEMKKDDYLLIGFDLKKDPQTILDAYNDPTGITSAFNLNLLKRMNRELGANFKLDNFQHWENYDPITGETKSFIVSKTEQEVYLEVLEKSFSFDAWEAIYVELSQKYSEAEIAQIAKESGFKVDRNFYDQKNYFADSLWQAI